MRALAGNEREVLVYALKDQLHKVLFGVQATAAHSNIPPNVLVVKLGLSEDSSHVWHF